MTLRYSVYGDGLARKKCSTTIIANCWPKLQGRVDLLIYWILYINDEDITNAAKLFQIDFQDSDISELTHVCDLPVNLF